MTFTVRFDMRSPDFAGRSAADRYAAALEMAEWADRIGVERIILSEHHGAADGYLPSPLTLLGAMAARTERIRLSVTALIAPFHDPLRLAEDVVVLDNISRGRVELVLAAGYVPAEFAMFGIPMSERVARVTEAVTTLKAAFTGEEFEYRGRRVRITPPPCLPGGPPVLLGGSSPGAARRAARIADGFSPTSPGVWEDYRAEVLRLGRTDPGALPTPSRGLVILAEDPEQAWPEHAPYLLHEMNSYGEWMSQAAGVTSPYTLVDDAAALRAQGRYRILTPDQLVDEIEAAPQVPVALHPLCGGTPPELGWASLRLLEEKVLPALTARAAAPGTRAR